MRSPNKDQGTKGPRDQGTRAVAKLLGLGLVVMVVVGCARTITPPVVRSSQASWDGNEQNSGVIGFAGSGLIITSHARERYNGLIAVYGKNFTPELVGDAGVTATTTNTFLLDAEHVVKFATMNRWRKTGRPPANGTDGSYGTNRFESMSVW